MAFYKILAFFGRQFLGETDTTRPAADLTTDTTFTATIGRKEDAAASGAVGTTKSIVAYLKQIVGATAVGKLIALHKGSTITPTTAGVDLTGVASGDILVEEVAIQKITSSESNYVTRLRVISNDAVPLNHNMYRLSGNVVSKSGLSVGARYINSVNWKLASGKKLQVITDGANGTAGYLWTVKCRALTEGATIATA